MTYDEILQLMLSKVPDTLDKRKGGIMYLALAPVAFILSLVYASINAVYKDTFADEAMGDYLTKRCAERGIYRKNSTYALRKGNFNIDVPIGSRFGIDSITYAVVEKLPEHSAKVRCEQLGEIGNNSIGDLLPITTIAGLNSAKLTDILIPGEEMESDESLRIRYFDSLESQAFGGNVADYKEKIKNLNGVGGIKVYPVWNGGGTVLLIFVDSKYSKPSVELVDTIQTAIDPVVNGGQGLGIAPIGHVVTVEAVTEVLVNISSNITLVTGYVWEDVKPQIEKEIREYLVELSKTWEREEYLVVRIAYIESRILYVTGVIDIQGTLINGQNTNLILTDKQIPTLGDVVRG